ncbi:MAG: type II 3-dehydroquinate dehydratase [Bacteroidota bacterium]
MKKLLILNGPNLNLLGIRQPEIYGHQTFEQFYLELVDRFADRATLTYFQSNHEGALIDKLQEVGFEIDGIIFNPGGYTHTSVALRDTISAITAPVMEVHISDIHSREPFRHHSYISDVATDSIIGQGLEGYSQAIVSLLQ